MAATGRIVLATLLVAAAGGGAWWLLRDGGSADSESSAQASGLGAPAPVNARADVGADGRVAFRGIDPALVYVLRVTPPTARTDLRPFSQEPWTPRDLEIRLERGYVIRGVVEDARGNSVAKAYVTRKQPDGVEMTVAHAGPMARFRSSVSPRVPSSSPRTGPERAPSPRRPSPCRPGRRTWSSWSTPASS
jgi:hypothetical protein